MSWFEQSIMARKGVAKGKVGAKHAITEATQGKYHYTYGPFAKPALTVDPGAVVSCETHDAFGGAIKLATDKPSVKLNLPFLNPQNQVDRSSWASTSWDHRAASRVWRPCRHNGDRAAQQAAARIREEDRSDRRGRRQMERQDNAAV
jgi:hypothetical protein